jgi:hypothetical protein
MSRARLGIPQLLTCMGNDLQIQLTIRDRDNKKNLHESVGMYSSSGKEVEAGREGKTDRSVNGIVLSAWFRTQVTIYHMTCTSGFGPR